MPVAQRSKSSLASAALSSFLFRVRLRYTVLFLGLMVLLSTFLLGIHWIPDIVAGVATGVLGVVLARRIDLALRLAAAG